MMQRLTLSFLSLTMLVSAALAADLPATTAPALSAREIVARNVEAIGGLQAWHAVQTLSLEGKMEAGGNMRPTIAVPTRRGGPQMPKARPMEQAQLPFVMDMKRPHKVRIELRFNGQTAVQTYDGANGWKLRPFLNRQDVEPFTAEEAKAASMQAELDGPLVDYAEKGTKVEVEGTEKLEGRDNYRLKLTLKGGQVQHVWIDAENFLETKIEGIPRRLDGKYHPVATYMRDYRRVNGLMVAHLLETEVDGITQTEKIRIEKVTVNPKLEDARFGKIK